MRRVFFFLIAVSFLATMVGCNTCGSGSCGSSGCGSSGCGAGGCGTGGCTSGAFGNRTHSHGVCDCTVDDYCTSRAPWIRYVQMAPAPVGEPITVAPTKVLPEGKMKL